MAVDVRILVVLLVYMSNFVTAQERCAYMIAIPREPRPDNLPELKLDGLTWNERPLFPAPDRDDVCMDEYYAITPTLGTQIIYMEEEIEGDVVIAKLNYNGRNTPFIVTPFVSGSFSLLAPVIRRIPESTGDWHLVITQRQDYEAPGMQQYVFNIRVDDEPLIASVSLIIVNIDDNAPIIHIFEACQVPELGEARLTECVYNVTDADGRISTEFMTFRVDSDRGDDEIFYMEGTNIPGQWMWMLMTVGINTSLNYETNPLHIFSVTALDSFPNTHTVTMMVQVENVEHRPPRWLEIFAVQQFDEKTSQTFTVRAIDGDTGIDKPIYYKLETAEDDDFFEIETVPGGRSGAVFRVAPIDRDFLEREVFQLSIIAYKYDNESFATEASVVIIVNDINDQFPRPLYPEYHIEILEETPLTLNFDRSLGFHDRDLGQHAQYTVHLESISPPGAAEAFYIAPEVGYQRQTFIMGTSNHNMLDYEVPEFQTIILKVVAIDMNDTRHVGEALLHIDLINWNDELPIFEENVQTVSFNETEGAGFYVGTVIAHDRDIDDRVEHTLLGNAVNFLTIDRDTGAIYVSANDSFDYHRQSEIFVQVRADDTLGEPYNTATSQLVIQLLDINNTPPTLRLPRGSPQVEENVPEGYEITHAITATDPDTTAELRFEIDWDTSYATKQGRETPTEEFRNCVDIQTLYPVINSRGSAIGRIVVREIRDNVTIDFEEFEMLYLTIRVRDLNTEIGEDFDESTFTITIIDMNDNPPVWVDGTLDQEFRVREMSASGVVIGSVLATDIDGPLYNQVRYTIRTRGDTILEDLVMIDFYTGQISVNTSGAIDADTPPRYNLYYTVIASDRCYAEDQADCPPDPTYWETEGNITIHIIDTNNKVPQLEYDKFSTVVYIYENASHLDEVVRLVSDDLDRDEIYNTVRYQIHYAVNPRLRDFFAVDLDTGLVYVNYITDEVLDRDGDEPTHRIFFNLFDNFFSEGDGNRNQNDTEVLVVLLDVNDNAPELPEPHELSWSISEGLTKGVTIEPDIYAPDRDEPDTDNSRVGYAILSLTVTNRDMEPPELFIMNQIENVTGELETAMDLRGYWGTYEIHILAFDHGIPQQSSNETYELVIRPYNFHAPVFQYPQSGAVIRLARERAVINGMLATVAGDFMDPVHATDEDGLHAGVVTYEVVGDAAQYFQVLNNGENLGILMLTQLFTEDIREFQVTIRATDGGTEPHSLSTDCTFSVVFVPTQREPAFVGATYTVAFIEGEAGMSERHELPKANDPKNHLCQDDCYSIYYAIVDGNADGYFVLDPVNNVISLQKELNREASILHTIVVAASNSPIPSVASAESTLTVTINVRESSPRPVFDRHIYTAGISTSDSINRELLTLQATHSEGATLTFTMDMTTMVVDSTLEPVRESAFVLNPVSGILILNIQVSASMHGMFEFDVLVTDPAGATDRAEVKVYLISSLNRVTFVFVNTIQQIEDNRDFIAQTLGVGFSMTFNIDQVVPASDQAGVAVDGVTEVRGHFIRDHIPVPATEIELLRTDLVLLTSIQVRLDLQQLVLQDFVTDSSPEAGVDSNQRTIYVLAALSALLGFMCLILLLTFIIRTKALNRRLEALSMTKYGSLDSGLNRAGIAAPGTNKHAIEGSNPIYNEAVKMPQYDTTSIVSDGSDLIGVEDLVHFGNYFPPADSNSLKGNIGDDKNGDSIANHNNNFGFNATPFTPEFVNSPFKR